MHDYRRFVQETMDAKHLRAADVERAGGPSRQVLSRILTDARPALTQRPDQETVEALAKGLGVSVDAVLASIASAMGLPLATTTARLEDVPADALLNELRRRLTEAGETRGNTAPMNPKESSEATAQDNLDGRQDENPQNHAETTTAGDRGDRTFDLSPTRAHGDTQREVGHHGHQDDFDLAAHPAMPLAADRLDAEFDSLGEDNQDPDHT